MLFNVLPWENPNKNLHFTAHLIDLWCHRTICISHKFFGKFNCMLKNSQILICWDFFYAHRIWLYASLESAAEYLAMIFSFDLQISKWNGIFLQPCAVCKEKKKQINVRSKHLEIRKEIQANEHMWRCRIFFAWDFHVYCTCAFISHPDACKSKCLCLPQTLHMCTYFRSSKF